MKASILYYSRTGHTKAKAELIAQTMQAEGVDAKAISIETVDEAWVKASDCIVLGTPVYYAVTNEAVEKFLATLGKYDVAGKIGGAFSSARYAHGGGEMAIQNILTRMLFWGMLPYSSGTGYGDPPIHLGPIAVDDRDTDEFFRLYGERMAKTVKKFFKD